MLEASFQVLFSHPRGRVSVLILYMSPKMLDLKNFLG